MMRKLLFIPVLMVALTAIPLVSVPAAHAGNPNLGVIPVQAHPHGYSYGEWTAAFSQWVVGQPASTNPLFNDSTGAFCGEGQSGSVWFLGPSGVSNPVVPISRICTIPAGQTLFVNVAFSECSTVEGNGGTEAGLRACVRANLDLATNLALSVDGVPVANIVGYRAESPLYTLAFPADNIFGLPGSGSTQSVAAGYSLMLTPLLPGQHTIWIHDDFVGFGGSDVTYHLTIGR